MAIPKQVQAIRLETQRRAIESYAGFVGYVTGKVEKIGLEAILKSKDGDEYYYLKSMLKRVLDFAEEVQLKMVPQKFEGDITQTVLMGEIVRDGDPLRFNIGSETPGNSGRSLEAPSDN